jgi:predicted ester cyclase
MSGRFPGRYKWSQEDRTMKNALTALALTVLAAAPATAAKKLPPLEFMQHYFEAVDSKKPERLAEVDASDIVMVTPMGTFKGLEGHKQMTAGFAAAFPNFKHTATRCIEQGDTISCEGNFAGDHTGPMRMPNGQVVPATQKHVEFPWVGMVTLKNGKVATLNVAFDTMAMMVQLGLVPSPTVAKK